MDFKEANLFSETFHRLARVIRSRLPRSKPIKPHLFLLLQTIEVNLGNAPLIEQREFPNMNEIKLVFTFDGIEKKSSYLSVVRNFLILIVDGYSIRS